MNFRCCKIIFTPTRINLCKCWMPRFIHIWPQLLFDTVQTNLVHTAFFINTTNCMPHSYSKPWRSCCCQCFNYWWHYFLFCIWNLMWQILIVKMINVVWSCCAFRTKGRNSSSIIKLFKMISLKLFWITSLTQWMVE